MATNWQDNLINSESGVSGLLGEARRVAVLGIKTEEQGGQPAFYVPEYLKNAGYEIIPVPVYYPETTEILGEKVYRQLTDVPGSIDLVVIFRRSGDVLSHVDDILAASPAAVWMQSGIRNDEAARRLAESGIKVVQDRCTIGALDNRGVLAVDRWFHDMGLAPLGMASTIVENGPLIPLRQPLALLPSMVPSIIWWSFFGAACNSGCPL